MATHSQAVTSQSPANWGSSLSHSRRGTARGDARQLSKRKESSLPLLRPHSNNLSPFESSELFTHFSSPKFPEITFCILFCNLVVFVNRKQKPLFVRPLGARSWGAGPPLQNRAHLLIMLPLTGVSGLRASSVLAHTVMSWGAL